MLARMGRSPGPHQHLTAKSDYDAARQAPPVTAIAVTARERKRQPDARALTSALSTRAWNVQQVLFIFGLLFSLYFAASFLGLFFYEEDIPLVRLVAALAIQGLLFAAMVGVIKKQSNSLRSWYERFGCSRAIIPPRIADVPTHSPSGVSRTSM